MAEAQGGVGTITPNDCSNFGTYALAFENYYVLGLEVHWVPSNMISKIENINSSIQNVSLIEPIICFDDPDTFDTSAYTTS